MLAKTLQESIDAWAGFYQDSTPTQIGLQFLHIGGLLGAGGLAISSDRDLIRQRSADPAPVSAWVTMGREWRWAKAKIGASDSSSTV